MLSMKAIMYIANMILTKCLALGAATGAVFYAAGVLSGNAVAFQGGCAVDLDRDRLDDLALLVRRDGLVELIVLLHRESGYDGRVLYRGKEGNLLVSCRYAKIITSTAAGKGSSSVPIAINGMVVAVAQPESSETIFYWRRDGFEEVQISD